MNTNVTIKIGEANTTIEGNPIELKGIELSYQIDANAQEMSVSGNILNNVYDKIQDMAKSFNTPIPTSAPTITSTETTENTSFCEVQKNEPKPEKVERRLDIMAAYQCLEKVLTKAGWENDHYGNLKYENKDENCEISLENKKIECHFHTEKTHVNIYIREKNTNILGIAPQFAEKWFKESKIPGIKNVWEVIKDFVSDKEDN